MKYVYAVNNPFTLKFKIIIKKHAILTFATKSISISLSLSVMSADVEEGGGRLAEEGGLDCTFRPFTLFIHHGLLVIIN